MTPLYLLGFAIGTTVVLLLLVRLAQRLLGDAPAEPEGNPARRLWQAGQVLGIFLVASAVVGGCVHGQRLGSDLLWACVFGISGLLVQVATGRASLWLLLGHHLRDEIGRGNTAAGVAAGAHYVATSILIARCLYGDDLATLGVSLAFFAIAQLTLHLFVALFRAVTIHDDRQVILDGNVAAAISYGGLTIALGLIIGHAAEGTFESWSSSLSAYLAALTAALALYPVRQLVVEGILLGAWPTLRGRRLQQGIEQDRNPGTGALEAVAYLATALLLNRLV